MKRYLRTKDGRIVDVQKFIGEEKDTPYYYDFKFDQIKNEEDYCVLNWTAVGSKENSIKEQVGKRCQFGVTISSPFIAQADTIEELCDVLVVCDPQLPLPFIRGREGGGLYLHPSFEKEFKEGKLEAVYGSIWVGGNLLKAAKMNEKGELELL